jgi:ABC-2 type transport system permease protein
MTALEQRRVPPLGGFNLTFLAVEIRRLFRNRRTLVITLVVPVVLTLLFRTGRRNAALQATQGADYQALITIGLAVYGAMLAATSGGAIVSVERALGWSRQLRLTPLRPPAYIAIKLLVAMTLGLISVLAVFVVSAVEGVQLSISVWLLSGALAWVGALVFAAFGLFMGYLLPTENVMQFIAPVLAALAFVGGLFVPLTLLPSTIQDVAPYTPVYGVVEIARLPLRTSGFDPTWLLNVVLWTAAFAAGAMLLFRRDTRRT